MEAGPGLLGVVVIGDWGRGRGEAKRHGRCKDALSQRVLVDANQPRNARDIAPTSPLRRVTPQRDYSPKAGVADTTILDIRLS